jgi:hypothetical protein
MKAHITDSELKTVELEFDGKKYNVAASLDVIEKVENLSEKELESVTGTKKIISWLVNDAIARNNLKNGTHEKAIPLEYFGLLIGKSNLEYYSEAMKEVLGVSAESSSPELDDEGNEIVVTDEMVEEFGELPEAKNLKTE